MKRPREDSSSVNCYSGHILHAGEALDVVVLTATNASDFFAKYVSQRRPCVLKGVESCLKAPLTLEALQQLAGDRVIEAEVPPFGAGNKKAMRMSEFCASIDRLYLTTQTIDDDAADQISPPLEPFVESGHLPRALPLFGALKLANLNMWCGGAAASRTPLHVDFHDNFYFLSRGRKQFALFSPADALKLQTQGEIERVYANGLINFKGFPTNADGSTAMAVAEKELADAGSDEEKEEEALEKLLKAQHDGGDGDWGDDDDDDDEEEAEEKNGEKGNDEKLSEECQDNCDPNHFCGLTAEEAEKNGCVCIRVDLSEGDTLYLPAGWFHQVTSFAEGTYHLAVNWWLFPPDVNSFNKPYSTIAWYDANSK